MTPISHMQNPLYVSPLRWIKLTTYCQLSGDSSDAVHARRRKHQWTDGLHCKIGPDGNLWINPEEVNKWVESNEKTTTSLASRALGAHPSAHGA
jgi:hypothetical protein